MKRLFDKLPIILFVTSCATVIFGYGVAVGRYHIFPFGILAAAVEAYQSLDQDAVWYVKKARNPEAEPVTNTGLACQGVNLVTRIGKNLKLIIEVISLDGDVLHRWNVDWFDLWPNPNHLPPHFTPESRPGTHVNGAVLLANGDVVFNFDYLGLMRLDPEGHVVWRLPYQTHHSVHLDEDGNLWVCGLRERPAEESASYYLSMPNDEYTILLVSPEGEVLKEWSIERFSKKIAEKGFFPWALQISLLPSPKTFCISTM